MLRHAVPALEKSRVLDDGCGVGAYVQRLGEPGTTASGLEYELQRAA